MKIWVLYGGLPSEREVSLNTSKAVIEALKAKGHEVLSFDVQPGNLLSKKLNIPWESPPDVVFLGLHGRFGEDGTLQGFLETLKIPYVGSGVAASALAFDKVQSRKILSSAGLPVPRGWEFDSEKALFNFINKQEMSFFKQKLFIKPSREGSTVGIERWSPELFEDNDIKVDFLNTLRRVLKFDSKVVIEEWIMGPEYTVAIFEKYGVLPPIEIRPKSAFYDYQSKYTAGATEYLCPAPLKDEETKKLQEIALKAFNVLGCVDYGRLDVMCTQEGQFKILEMNTLPGMTKTSLVPKAAKAAGMDFPDFIEKLILASLERQVKDK